MAEKFYADSMAFFALQGKPPILDPAKRPDLGLAHLTSAPPMFTDFDKTLALHNEFRAQALSNPDVREIREKADLMPVPGEIALLFGLQHAPDGLTKERVRALADAGVRSMALTYNSRNEYGDGCEVPEGGCLTEKGQRLVEWMAESNIILDLSHVGEETALDILDFRDQKALPLRVMASHSGAQTIFDHPRNMSNLLIKLLHASDGYVGVPAITFLIAHQGDAYLQAVAEHIALMLTITNDNKFVGIGSDCNHIDMSMEEAEAHYGNMKRMLKIADDNPRFYFPDRPEELILHGSEMFERFDEALDNFPDRVLGENFRRFLERSID